jgi:ribosomal protein S20
MKARIDDVDVDWASRRRLESAFHSIANVLAKSQDSNTKRHRQTVKRKILEDNKRSTFLQLLRVVDQLLSLLFVEEDDIRQKLININKKFKRIESSTIKTKTNVESYATTIKAEDWSKANTTIIKHQKTTKKTNSQKILHEIKKRKTMMIKINDEIKKMLFRFMIIKDLIQKLTIMRKKKTYYRWDVCSATIWSCWQAQKRQESEWKKIVR